MSRQSLAEKKRVSPSEALSPDQTPSVAPCASSLSMFSFRLCDVSAVDGKAGSGDEARFFRREVLSCPEWQFNGPIFRDARLDRFSCRFGSRSEFTDNVERLTSRHPDCRQPLLNRVTSELPVI